MNKRVGDIDLYIETTIVQGLDKQAIYSIEMLTNRFAKLQDYLGSIVFDIFFDIEGEDTATWTSIDKVNQLEKYGIIQDAHVWRAMRKARNFLAYEYPDKPEIIAVSLNVIYDFVPVLLEVNAKIFARILRDI